MGIVIVSVVVEVNDIKQGWTSAEFTLDLHGRFEKGRWVNDATPLFDYFMDNPTNKPPTFNITAKYTLDYFEKGVYIRSEEKEKDLGEFRLEQVKELGLY